MTGAASLALLAALAVPAAAPQGPMAACADRDRVRAHLEATWGERVAGGGLAANGGWLELLVSADRRTWSVVLTTPQGVSCMIASGETWEPTPAPAQDEGA